MLNEFQYIEEISKELLKDNMKTLVSGHEADKAIWNPQFSDFTVEMGAGILKV